MSEYNEVAMKMSLAEADERENNRNNVILHRVPEPKGKELSPHDRTKIRIQSSYGPRFRNTNLLCTENTRITEKLDQFMRTTVDAIENKAWMLQETVSAVKEKFTEPVQMRMNSFQEQRKVSDKQNW